MVKEIIVHIFLALFIGVLARYFPTLKRPVPAYSNEATLKRLYDRSIRIYVAGFVIWTILCSWVMAQILHQVAVWNNALLSDTAITILPPASAWLIPGVCFAFAWYRGPVEGLIRTMMGQDALVAIYTMRTGKYDYVDEILWRYLQRTLIFLSVAAIFVLLDTSIYVYPERIVFNEGTSVFVQKSRHMDEIAAIRLERDTLNEKAISPSPPNYVISFRDGYSWKSNWSDFREAEAVVLHIARQNRLKIDTFFMDTRKYSGSN